ncbi:12895_t:CDS:2, partial [Racocetra persica]
QITQEQNKVQQKETELVDLREEIKDLQKQCLVADEIKDTDLSETILDGYFVEKLKEFMLEKDIKPETPNEPTEDYYNKEIKETKITPCILAQEYINQEYPINGTCQIKEVYPNNFGKTREEIKELSIYSKDLEGELDLSDFKNLEKLSCSYNYLTNLNINNCKKLKEISCHTNQLTTLNLSNLAELKELLWCSDNYLTEIPYLSNPEKITKLGISNNNINPSDLSIFSKFRNLKDLYIGNDDKNKINQGIYNRFHGSLEPLKDLNNL